jgi:RND superfamily putative drug exporter
VASVSQPLVNSSGSAAILNVTPTTAPSDQATEQLVRRLRDDTNLASGDAGPPGSVVTGTSDARHPTEAPDDLADARRWVDDA